MEEKIEKIRQKMAILEVEETLCELRAKEGFFNRYKNLLNKAYPQIIEKIEQRFGSQGVKGAIFLYAFFLCFSKDLGEDTRLTPPNP